jgi:hypothetical protein
MDNHYAIIDEAGGWLVNLVVWDGDTNTWRTKEGTVAIPISQVDFASLPQKPEEIE